MNPRFQLAMLASLVATAVPAQTYHVRIVDTAPEGCAAAPLQVLIYDASSTLRALESTAAWGTRLVASDDMQVAVEATDEGPIDATLDGIHFEDAPAPGHLLQTVAYWPCADGLRLSFDSMGMFSAGPDDIVDLGTRGTVVLHPPTTLRDHVNQTVLVQWHGVTEPQEMSLGRRDSAPGAIIGWNLYRLEQDETRFVTFVYNDAGSFSVVVPEGATFRETTVRYGIVPVFRSTGVGIGPQQMGIEIPAASPSELPAFAPVPRRPMLVLSDPIQL